MKITLEFKTFDAKIHAFDLLSLAGLDSDFVDKEIMPYGVKTTLNDLEDNFKIEKIFVYMLRHMKEEFKDEAGESDYV